MECLKAVSMVHLRRAFGAGVTRHRGGLLFKATYSLGLESPTWGKSRSPSGDLHSPSPGSIVILSSLSLHPPTYPTPHPGPQYRSGHTPATGGERPL